MNHSEHHDHDHDHDHDMGHMDMMKMYFHSGLTDKNILIYGWDATDGARMAGTLIGLFLIGAFYEWIKFIRVMHHKSVNQKRMDTDPDTPDTWIEQVSFDCLIILKL